MRSTIQVGDDVVRAPITSTTSVRTTAAPADWEPLPEGPQNLRATATHDSITVRWDPPFPEGDLAWFCERDHHPPRHNVVD